MTTLPTLDVLLEAADAHARAGDWQETLQALDRANAVQPDHAGVLTGLGTCLIQLGRPAEAVSHFRRVIELAPGSPDAHNNLGVVLALTGQYPAAQAAYERALECDSEHTPTWKNLAQAHLEQNRPGEGIPILAALIKANPNDVEALMMLAACYAEVDDHASARALYEQVLKTEPQHPEARAALARLPRPVADLSRLARPEHARKLAALKTLKRTAAVPRSTASATAPPVAVAFYGTGEVSDGVRLGVPAAALSEKGVRVKLSRTFANEDLDQYDVFVFSRPQLSPPLMDGLSACRRAGKRIVVDLDDDFHHLPADHPGYRNVGPGNPRSLQALESAIAQADLLTVATPVLAERYARYARRVEVVPNGWSRANPLWDKPAPRRSTINIGWAGTPTHREDVALIQKDLVRLLRETPEAMLVIGGDPGVYETFSALPEKRRLFLPMTRFEDYPFMLAHFDVLLAPLREDEFNQAKSDIKLLEAGIRRIPWVASPLPAYKDWGAGGLFAEKPGEWYAALKRLVEDAALRRQLGEVGREKAEGREGRAGVNGWLALVQKGNNASS